MIVSTEALHPAGWQPIESAPKDETPILIACNMYVELARFDGHVFTTDGTSLHWLQKATHWMPLPAPPSATEVVMQSVGSESTREGERIIAYKNHAGLPGNWRARKVRYGMYRLEVELPCINGLSAWFSIGTLDAAEDEERLMTDGARLEAGDYAKRIVGALSLSPDGRH